MLVISNETSARARKIKLLLTDCDGVLTDGGVYYSANGEEMKKFSLRDGMGVERLWKLANIETGILTKETSDIVLRRAEKLGIKEYHPGATDKMEKLLDILKRKKLSPQEVAYIGDDANDIEVLTCVGLSACPADALPFVAEIVSIVLEKKGGDGAFRELAEIIINAQLIK